MLNRSILRVLALLSAAMLSAGMWVWLFYLARAASWWRREYVYAALGAVVVAGLVLTFHQAQRTRSSARAAGDAGLTLLGCAGVAAIAYFSVAWIGPELLR